MILEYYIITTYYNRILVIVRRGMDDLLVFSHQSRIKCCTFFSKEQILLADDTGLTLFDIGKASPIMESE